MISTRPLKIQTLKNSVRYTYFIVMVRMTGLGTVNTRNTSPGDFCENSYRYIPNYQQEAKSKAITGNSRPYLQCKRNTLPNYITIKPVKWLLTSPNLTVFRKFNYLVRNEIRKAQICFLSTRVIWTDNADTRTDRHVQ